MSKNGTKKKKKKRPPLPAPTEQFVRAFCDSASVVVVCECGRLYFSTGDGGDFGDGELEHYQEMAKKEPGKYIEVTYFTRRVDVDGREYAEDCPCNGARRYENWIWSHRFAIAEFLKKRSEEEFKQAELDKEMVAGEIPEDIPYESAIEKAEEKERMWPAPKPATGFRVLRP